MPAKTDLYAELMKEYYRLEEALLAEAAAGLAVAKTPEASRAMLEIAVSQLRTFVVKALQSQALRLSEIEAALRMTGDSLATAQQRIEGMEQENAEAAAVLFKMKVRSESQPQAAQAQELADRVIEQEKLLQKRENEMAELRKRILEAQADRSGLLRRLEAEERRTESPEPAAVAEMARLGGLLAEAQAVAKQREAEQAAQAGRLAQSEAEAASLRERLMALEKAAPPAGEVPTLRARLAELERRLAAEPVADVAALRSQLKEEETFRAAFLQRIQALEGARYRAQEDAKLAAQKIAASEKVPWTQERAELQGRLAALEKDLNRLRAINENSRSEWTATLARQDALRLAEIAGLKRQLEELRPDRSPG